MHDPCVTVGKPPANLKRQLVLKVIDFVFSQLDEWRDSKRKICVAETKLNEQLCVFLSDRARADGLFLFHHEQSQIGQHRVDISAKPVGSGVVAYGYDSIYDTITIFEAKRLPAPTKARKYEYVTGCTTTSGGIQRFRLCLHGQGHDVAGMIGYIQKGEVDSILREINKSFKSISGCSDGLAWSCSDNLKSVEADKPHGKARTQSVHLRCDGTIIHLHHLWVEMNHR